MSLASAGDPRVVNRRRGRKCLATVGVVSAMILISGCVSPIAETNDADTNHVNGARIASIHAVDSLAGKDRLQNLADAERQSTPAVCREVPLPPGLASAAFIEIPSIRPLDLIVADHFDERHASMSRAVQSEGRVSVEAVRDYVRGRALLVSGRPIEAIPLLESAIRSGGGATGMRTLAEACDAAGRDTDAIAMRRRLAVLGTASDKDLRRLFNELVRRRRLQEAVAVSAAQVKISLNARDGRVAGEAAVRLAESLDAMGDLTAAAEVRASILSMARTDETMLGGLSNRGLAELHLLAGDDAAKALDAVAADAFWRVAMSYGVIDPAVLRPRLLWSSAVLGRDSTVQWLMLEASTAPSGGDLELAIILREQGLPMVELCDLLEARLRRNPHDVGAARMLVVLDPVRVASVLNNEVAHRASSQTRLSLVDAALAGGPATSILVAAGVMDSMDLLDPVVDRLVEGPWTEGELLETTLGEEIMTANVDTTLVRTEILRRHDRPDLARAVLNEAVSTGGDGLRRMLAIRLAAGEADPASVLTVDDQPFDSRVEAERVLGLLAAGEPELAVEFAERGVRRSPMSPEIQAALGRSLSQVRGRELEAVEATARAVRLGDRRWSTQIELGKFVNRIQAELPVDSEVKLAVVVIGEDPVFRRLVEADQALANGDLAAAERLLDGMLERSGAKEEVLIRMLGIWKSLGRREQGRRRVESLLARHPGDPALLDARLALRRSQGDRQSLLDELRMTAAESLSGLPSHRLELLLAETDADRSELAELVRRRLSRRPGTPARLIDELELAILLGDSQMIDQAVRGCEKIEVALLTPRLRRRLASVAAAVPNRNGEMIVRRIAAWSLENSEPVNVDVAAAIVMTTSLTGESRRTDGHIPAAAYSRRDLDWRPVGLSISETDVEAGAELLRFALDAPDAESPANAGLLRSAIASGIVAGWSGRRIQDLLERQVANGKSLADSYGMDVSDRLALSGASGDASLLGRRDLAIELLGAAVAQSDADVSILNNLGFALLEGDSSAVDRATALLQEAYGRDPSSPSVLDSLGWLRYLEGRHGPDDAEGALLLISQSIEARLAAGRSVSGEVLLHFGDAAWRAGRQSDAVNAWSGITRKSLTARELTGRLAAYADYQKEIWGRVFTPPAEMYEDIEGRWIQAAELRLRAIAEGEPPPVTPTFSERAKVQNSSE